MKKPRCLFCNQPIKAKQPRMKWWTETKRGDVKKRGFIHVSCPPPTWQEED